MKINFHIPTKVVMDEDCIKNSAPLIAGLGKKALIVTGARSAKANGSLDDLCSTLKTNDQEFVVFNKVMSNPTIDCVYEGAALAKSEKADFVVSIGGGSPMDAAKAIAMLSVEDIEKGNIFLGGYKKRLPLCCVPTTAGTGSEVTQYSILMDDAAQTKTSLASPVLFPDVALLDSKYMASLSKATMANTVIDSLSHSVEGYISNRANAISDALALEAIKIIADTIPAIYEWRLTSSDMEKLLYASTLGGMVIAHTGTTSVHSMGYSLTYFKDIDHGRANGLLLTEFLKFVESKCPERIAVILEAMGVASTGEIGDKLNLLLGEKESITDEEIDKFASIAIKAKNNANSMAVPTEADLKKLYRLSFGLD